MQLVKLEVVKILDYGLLVKEENEKIGLIHISEVGNFYIDDLNKFFKVGEIIEAVRLEDCDKNSFSLKKTGKKRKYREYIIETKNRANTLKSTLPKKIEEFLSKKNK